MPSPSGCCAAAKQGRRDPAAVRALRCSAARRWLSRHGRADRRRHHHPGATAEAQQGREGNGQGRRCTCRLVEGEADADGHGRPLADQARAAAPARRGRVAGACRRRDHNATGARVRVAVEHVFAAQKCRFGLIIRSVGLARATARLGLAHLVTNMTRLAWFATRAAPI
jgi:hypothetical protein